METVLDVVFVLLLIVFFVGIWVVDVVVPDDEDWRHWSDEDDLK